MSLLPAVFDKIRNKLQAYQDGDKQFIDILQFVYKYGLDNITHACSLAITAGGCSTQLVEKYLQPAASKQENTDECQFIKLQNPPDADCSIYSKLYLKLWGNK